MHVRFMQECFLKVFVDLSISCFDSIGCPSAAAVRVILSLHTLHLAYATGDCALLLLGLLLACTHHNDHIKWNEFQIAFVDGTAFN